MDAILALEDDKIFRGKSFGATGERYGEVVFNTSMTGYQEILTDPSYKGQMVDTCAAEFEAFTPYYYSTYESNEDAT